ncbi:MAG: hypothetical protein HKN64_08085 [Woeseiaceae bacterium]|nr:hypothetical protein [Woeseiaceae bacterium]
MHSPNKVDRHASDPVSTVEREFHAVLEQLEAHAVAADWDDVEALTAKVRLLVLEIPAANRRSALLAAQRCVNRAEAAANSAREALSGRLRDLSRGKAAKKAYELR